jgi:hypothetical protein
MHRLVLALAGITTVVCADFAWCAEPVPMGGDLVYPAEICWPLPPSYPRGWEIVIRTPDIICRVIFTTTVNPERFIVSVMSLASSIAGPTCGPVGGGNR